MSARSEVSLWPSHAALQRRARKLWHIRFDGHIHLTQHTHMYIVMTDNGNGNGNGRRKRLRQTTLCHPLCHHYGFARLPEEVICLIMQHYRAGLHKRMLLAEIKFAYGYALYFHVQRYWGPDPDTEFEDPYNDCFDEAHAINCGAFPIAQLMLDEERPKRGFA